jgi:hypothetical protein
MWLVLPPLVPENCYYCHRKLIELGARVIVVTQTHEYGEHSCVETKVLFIATLYWMSILISLTYFRELSLNHRAQTGSGAHTIGVQKTTVDTADYQNGRRNSIFVFWPNCAPAPSRIPIGLPVLVSDVMLSSSELRMLLANCTPIILSPSIATASNFSIFFFVYLSTLSLAQAAQRQMIGSLIIVKDMEGSGRGLISRTIPAFGCLRKATKISIRVVLITPPRRRRRRP